MLHHKPSVQLCGSFRALRSFLLVVHYFSLHSKLSLRSLNSWKIYSEGVRHIFYSWGYISEKEYSSNKKFWGKSLEILKVNCNLRKSQGENPRKTFFSVFSLLSFFKIGGKVKSGRKTLPTRTAATKRKRKINRKSSRKFFCVEEKQFKWTFLWYSEDFSGSKIHRSSRKKILKLKKLCQSISESR